MSDTKTTPFLRLRLFFMYLFMAVYSIFQPKAALRVLTDADEAKTERDREAAVQAYRRGLTELSTSKS